MSTKSNRSSGTQHNQRGVAQGVTLVDPKTGFPVAVVIDANGKYRLAVDALITANVGNVNVDLNGVGPTGDNVYLVDNVTGNKFKVNADGSIDANVELDAEDGDNVAISSHPQAQQIYRQTADTITTAAFEQIFTYTSTDNGTRIINITSTVSTPSLIQVKINGTIIRQLWTSPIERNAIFDFKENRTLANGDILTVEAKVDILIHPTYETFTSLEGYLN